MSRNPLLEVFGYPIDNFSPQAERFRSLRLCPYNNKVPNCTKDKADNPLGVCSIRDGDHLAITCPVRFRQDWLIAEDAARFFFPEQALWTSLVEVRLNDQRGESAGNIDVVLVAYDRDTGRILDFGALEVQAVYISGNIRRPFEHYLENPGERHDFDWVGQRNYPRPDYLSSSRKRLVPQLMYKGGILNSWGKKMAIALHKEFFDNLPNLPQVEPGKAEVVWLVYDLQHDVAENRYHLMLYQRVYTLFSPMLERIAVPQPGALRILSGICKTNWIGDWRRATHQIHPPYRWMTCFDEGGTCEAIVHVRDEPSAVGQGGQRRFCAAA